MILLVNASNLKAGGALQVTQSICGQLNKYSHHRFIVVLSSFIDDSQIEYGYNTKVYRHNVQHSFSALVLGRDHYLDSLVLTERVDAVLTIFGPSIWHPRVPHLCGFARAQLVLKDSPYYKRLSLKERLVYRIWKRAFKKSSDTFYTENEYITHLLPDLLGPSIKTYTVTNYYNQVFDIKELWKRSIILPSFDGITCLSVSSYYRHKNFELLFDLVSYLRESHPDFKVRFVLTFDEKEMPVPEAIRDAFVFVGSVDVYECPNLYEQSEIMFMPTLLECFTATYPEAMRMGIPIVTVNLEFARGLCGDAACYYSALDAVDAAEAIRRVAMDNDYAEQLIANGKEQLKKFDNYEQRTKKLIDIMEGIASHCC